MSGLDPYVEIAQNDCLKSQEKIDGLKEILKNCETGMLTTRGPSGMLHSRAMRPCAPTSETQLTLVFIANNKSHKFEELVNDDHVNVSFYDPKTTCWASFAGTAKITDDREVVKKHWNTITKAWFGDLKDGVHHGDENDPRVSVIEVIPKEIHYWLATKGIIRQTVSTMVDAALGKTSVPGELRTITEPEIGLTLKIQGVA